VKTGATLLREIFLMYGEKVNIMPGIQRLFGVVNSSVLIQTMEIDDILKSCEGDLKEYMKIREKYLIYQ